MPKYFDAMGNDVTSYVATLVENEEKLKASQLEIVKLKAEIKRLKTKKKETE